MNITKVTVTGADNSVDPKDLIPIAKEFPFVEFGILLSKNGEGFNRFPDRKWVNQFFSDIMFRCDMPIETCGHICGRWVRDLCTGGKDIIIQRPEYFQYFNRMQLNFHAIKHSVKLNELANILRPTKKQFILQMDEVNEDMMKKLQIRDVNVVPLFDTSGGKGVLPGEWPKQEPGLYSGYAGGLSPDNLEDQLRAIELAATDDIWIDAETHLRSNNDSQFDLDKVRGFLEIASKWVNKGDTK